MYWVRWVGNSVFIQELYQFKFYSSCIAYKLAETNCANLRAAYTILHYEMTDWKTNLPTNQQCHPLYNDLEKLFNWSTLEQADMGDKLGDEG